MQRVIVVAGGDLFTIAANYLQDATQWIRIAQANNLSDPVRTGVIQLIIPELNLTLGGGVAT